MSTPAGLWGICQGLGSYEAERAAITDDYDWKDAMVVSHDGPPDNRRCPVCHMYKRLCECDCEAGAGS